MEIVLIGGGDVGEAIASSLAENHSVTVVELDAGRADELMYTLDVRAIAGDGTDPDVLHRAEIESAELLASVTNDDRANIIAAATAKALTDVFTIARVKDSKYLRTWEQHQGAFGVDYLVATNILAAEAITRVVGLPTALDSDLFAGGLVHMAEFQITDDSPVSGYTVAEVDRFDSLTFAAILRNDEVEIPTGNTRIESGDRVVVIGSPESVHGFGREIAPDESPEEEDEVVIVGGSEIGYHVALLLSERGLSPRLVEQDPERAREIAEALPDTMVLQSDATDVGFLESEHIGDADVLVSALESDEKNLLEVLLAKRLGVSRSVAVIDRPSYFELFEAVGLDVGVSPRSVIAEEITRFTQAGNMENIAFVETDKAEVIEVEITGESILAGRTIQEIRGDLPSGVVFGAITRAGELISPRGDTRIEIGDHVIALAEISVADTVAERL